MIDDDTKEYSPARVGPDGIRERKILTGKRRRRAPFVMVPLVWAERLFMAKHRASWPVAFELLRRDLKYNGKPIPLPNGQLETKFKISRQRKWEALRELERLGLIRTECRSRKSPLVTIARGQHAGVADFDELFAEYGMGNPPTKRRL
jgi:hypothetical protein